MQVRQSTISIESPQPRPLAPRRSALIVAVLVAAVMCLGLLKGVSDEAAQAAFVTAKVKSDLSGALQGVARGAPYSDGRSSRIAVAEHGRTYFVIDFTSTRGRELWFEVERDAIMLLMEDLKVPPFRFGEFTIRQTQGTIASMSQLQGSRVEADATVELAGFLGRTQIISVSVLITPPHYAGPFGDKLAP